MTVRLQSKAGTSTLMVTVGARRRASTPRILTDVDTIWRIWVLRDVTGDGLLYRLPVRCGDGARLASSPGLAGLVEVDLGERTDGDGLLELS